jgi:hypothetical protein
VLAEAHAVFIMGQLKVSRRINAGLQYARLGTCYQCRQFPLCGTGSGSGKREDESKDCQVKRAVNEHDADASNEGRHP